MSNVVLNDFEVPLLSIRPLAADLLFSVSGFSVSLLCQVQRPGRRHIRVRFPDFLGFLLRIL